MLINTGVGSELDGLDLSLKPPKWLRKGAASVGRAVLKAAPIITTAAMFVPGVGTAIGAAGKAILGASRVIPGAATAISAGSRLATAAKAVQASRVVRTAVALKSASSLLPRRPASPQPLSPFQPQPLEPVGDTPSGAILPGRRRTFPIGRGGAPPVVPIGGRAPWDPFNNPILLPPPRPVTDTPTIKPAPTPIPVGVSVDPGTNPISLVPDERIQQLRDAAARMVGAPNPGAPTYTGAPGISIPSELYASSSAPGGAFAPASAEQQPQPFPWLPVIAVGGGLWLLSQKGSKR